VAVEARKAFKNRRCATVQVPALRLLGLAILWTIVAVENTPSKAVPWTTVNGLGMVMLVYATGSWALLARLHPRTSLNLSTAFLAIGSVRVDGCGLCDRAAPRAGSTSCRSSAWPIS
jgi:hypothetical protein